MVGARQTGQTPWLETKLQPPSRNGWTLARGALWSDLDASLDKRLAVVAAPAGFGKTVLVASWVERLLSVGTESAVDVGWLSLDAKDEDPISFWSHFRACVARLDVDVDVLDDIEIDPDAIDDVVAVAVNALASSERQHVLVFDDLHHVGGAGAILDPMFRFVEAAPPNVTVVVISRALPGWPMERHRARGDLLLLGPSDLAFSAEETAAVLQNSGSARELGDADIEAVHDRSEGWPVAVGLAAHGFTRHPSPQRIVASMSETNGAVAGFLLEEVLTGLDAALHRFLLDSSVLDTFCTDSATAVTGAPADDLVARLVAEHLFVATVDPQGQWCRLHPLIRELLLADLEMNDPARLRVLHRRAASWHQGAGDIETAVDHLLAAGDHDATASLIAESFDDQLLDGAGDSVLRWLHRLPDQLLEEQPRASSSLARLLVSKGRYLEARGWLDVAERSSDTDEQLVAVVAGRLALESALGNEIAVLDTLAQLDLMVDVAADPAVRRAALTEQANALPIRAVCNQFLGHEGRYQETLGEVKARRNELRRLAETAVDPLLALASADDGDLVQATSTAQLVLQRADRYHLPPDALAVTHLALARVAWCRGELDAAQRSVTEATSAEHETAVWCRTRLAVQAAELVASTGCIDQADEILEAAWEGTPAARTPALSRWWIGAWGSILNVAQGRRDVAHSWLAELQRLEGPTDVPPVFWASVELLQERPERVVTRFGSNGASLPSKPLPHLRIGLLLLEALRETNRSDAADVLTVSLLAHAEGHELVQPIVDCPSIVQSGLHLNAYGPSARFVRKLELVGGLDRDATPTAEPWTALPDPISPRELDLIRLLPTRLSNQELATELYISLNTVKTHLRHVYRKLAVTNRDQAIERCQELGLLAATSLPSRPLDPVASPG